MVQRQTKDRAFREDKDIIDEIEQALYLEDQDYSDNIQYTSENGKVVLTGNVQTVVERNHVQDIIENIPGVVMVDNYLKVDVS